MTTTMNFDPTLHSVEAALGFGTGAGQTAGAAGVSGAGKTAGKTAGVAGASAPAANPVCSTGTLAVFEGYLKKAGHIAGVVLSEIVQFAVPVAQIVAIADPAAAPAIQAFTTSVRLVETAVVSAQQRWAAEGSTANAQKLADVLLTVEAPIVLLFAQAGLQVDTAYVTNLVNGVVAVLNAQPGVVLQATK